MSMSSRRRASPPRSKGRELPARCMHGPLLTPVTGDRSIQRRNVHLASTGKPCMQSFVSIWIKEAEVGAETKCKPSQSIHLASQGRFSRVTAGRLLECQGTHGAS